MQDIHSCFYITLIPTYKLNLINIYIFSASDGAATTTSIPAVSMVPLDCNEPEAMVSGNMYIQDQYIRARSSKGGREAINARSNYFRLFCSVSFARLSCGLKYKKTHANTKVSLYDNMYYINVNVNDIIKW